MDGPDVDAGPIGGPRAIADSPASRYFHQQVRQISEPNRFGTTDVERLAVTRCQRTRPQERIHRVVHEDEVPHLLTVPEDADLVVLHDTPDEPADEALPIVPHELAWPVHVGE